jgi:hypothetical protein
VELRRVDRWRQLQIDDGGRRRGEHARDRQHRQDGDHERRGASVPALGELAGTLDHELLSGFNVSREYR